MAKKKAKKTARGTKWVRITTTVDEIKRYKAWKKSQNK